MTARRFVLLLVLAVLGLVATIAAACSGDESGATPPPPPPPSTAEVPPLRGPVVAIQDDHLGLPDSDLSARLELVRQSGARAARVDVFWKDIAPSQPRTPTDPSDPEYRFQRLDTIVRGLAAADIAPILAVYNPPAWATGGGIDGDVVEVYNSRVPAPGAYRAFLEALSRRYSGRFSSGGAGELPFVKYWEIWNEPNLDLYLSPQTDAESGARLGPEAYAGLVRAAYPAIKKGGGDETVVIVGAAGPRGASGKNGTGAFDWLSALRAADVPADAYSQHVYPAAGPTVPTDARPSWSSIPDLLAELDAWRPGLDLYITEAGYTTAETPFRNTKVSEEDQARFLEQMYALDSVNSGRVRAIVWFNLQDNPNWPAGLVRSDGAPKPSWEAYRRVAAAAGDRTLP